MRKLSNVVLMLSLLLAFSTAAMAQRNEIAGTVGGNFSTSSTFEPGVSIAGGAQYDGRVLHSKAAALYVDVPFVATTNSNFAEPITCALLSQCQGSYHAYFLTPGVKIKLAPDFPVSPYFVAGAGLAHYHSDSLTSSVPLVGNLLSSNSDNHFAFEVGGGLDFKVAKHVALRGEVRDFISTSPDMTSLFSSFVGSPAGKQNNVVPQAGIVFTF